jgi:hypothetical protein
MECALVPPTPPTRSHGEEDHGVSCGKVLYTGRQNRPGPYAPEQQHRLWCARVAETNYVHVAWPSTFPVPSIKYVIGTALVQHSTTESGAGHGRVAVQSR